MRDFSAGFGGLVGAFLVVATVVSVGLARGPYAGASGSPRRTTSESEPQTVESASRLRADSSGSRPSGPHASGAPAPVVGAASSELGLPGADLRNALAELDQKRKVGDVRGALAVLEKLAETDPSAFADSDLQTKVITMTQQVTLLPGGESDRMFALLATKSGTHGLDMLLYLVTNKGGSTASKLAEKVLDNPDVTARGSDAMQVAWALRKAKGCDEKKALFARAGEKGDRRARGQLEELNRACNRRRPGSCCLHNDPAMVAALAALEARGFK